MIGLGEKSEQCLVTEGGFSESGMRDCLIVFEKTSSDVHNPGIYPEYLFLSLHLGENKLGKVQIEMSVIVFFSPVLVLWQVYVPLAGSHVNRWSS